MSKERACFGCGSGLVSHVFHLSTVRDNRVTDHGSNSRGYAAPPERTSA
ncbi:hypothetical protein ACFOLD_00410 [Kocuria carniphila]